MKEFKLLVDGQLIAGVTRFPVVNPATEVVLAQCPGADRPMLDKAVAAAARALPAWSALSFEERANYIEQLAAAMEERADEFARLLTSEQGKPLDQAMGEIMGAIYILRTFAAMRISDKILRDENGNKVIEHRTPLGVCAAITPWNFPVILLANKVGPCLIAGNTLIAKPASTTPLTTLLMGELAAEIFPAGVFNVLAGELGSAITAHPGIAKVGFTGSTETGRKVMAGGAETMKRLTLELGGNDAAIVLDDISPKLAAEKVYGGAMTNAGQICVAIKRVYVPSSMYDEFCDEIGKLAKAAVVDDGSKQGTTVGPVQNKSQYEEVLRLLEDAKKRGKVVAGGELPDRAGYFIPPTIIRDLDDDAPLVREEQFGPVLPILSYSEIDEVINRANDSEFGLGGTVWSGSTERAIEVARRIDTGTVWVNQYLAIDPTIPFRGVRQSGIGAELGEAGLLEYTQAHVINAVELDPT